MIHYCVLLADCHKLSYGKYEGGCLKLLHKITKEGMTTKSRYLSCLFGERK